MKKDMGAKTLIYPNPVLLIGTYDSEGKPNAMTASWGGICSSEPPSIAVSVRKSRYTYNNLILNKEFTISIPSENYVREADYCGIYSGKNENKFNELKLTEVKSQYVNAPYIDEFPVILHCKVIHIFELGIHTQFVGEIINTSIDTSVLNELGKPDINKIKPIIYDVSEKAYHSIGSELIKGYSTLKKS